MENTNNIDNMQTSGRRINRDVLLPYGEKLKPVLNSNTIQEIELKNILSNRGIFVTDKSKEKTIPILTKTLLTPKEFERIIEAQRTKEENIKRKTRSIKCETERNLIDFLDMEIREDDLKLPEFRSYKLNSNLEFFPLNKNSLVLDYSILRDDPTKDWTSTEIKFSARVSVTKTDTHINFEMEYTAPETDRVNNCIVGYVRNILIKQNLIKKETKVDIITFSRLSNERRFEWMLNLSENSETGILKFKQIKNVEFTPDNSEEFVKDIKWMKERVKTMKLKGNELNNIKFLQDGRYRKCLMLSQIQSEFAYECEGGKRYVYN